MNTRSLSLLLSLALLTGCAKIQPGADPVVVNAEQLAESSFRLVDSFLRYEHAHRATVNKEVTRIADQLRTEFPKHHDTLRIATRAYKANRTPANKFGLETAMALIEQTQTIIEIHQPTP